MALTKIKVVTWNISGLDISDQSPNTFDLETKWEQIGQILEDQHPDVLALQELPNAELAVVYGVRLHLVLVYFVETHCGYTALYVREEWKPKFLRIYKTDSVVACTLDIDGSIWGIGSLHFAPSKGLAAIRKKMLEKIMSLFNQNTDRIILAGDTNMRKAEVSILPNLQLQDGFDKIGAPKTKRWTWDSYSNPYHHQGFQFRCRFDRIFLQGWDIEEYNLIGKSPIDTDCYLSDHFGISAVLKPSHE